MLWQVCQRADPHARALADRHYSRRRPGAYCFTPPGRCLTLLTPAGDAVWASSWQRPEWVQHAWPHAWLCSLFRNESPYLSSDLIRQAVAVTRFCWGVPPPSGFVTFINPARVRRKRDPGRCFRKAGWSLCGRTGTGLLVLHQLPPDMPSPACPRSRSLFDP